MMRILNFKSDSNVFVSCEEEKYSNKLNQKIAKLPRNQITPAIREDSPYKIHVSLAPEQYKKHRIKIIRIINQHIFKNSVIFSYKFVRNKILKNQIKEEKELLSLGLNYKHNLENKIIEPNLEVNLINKLKNYFKLDDSPDIKGEINEIISKLNDSIKSAQRFIDGDQFTLYIPENFDKNKIVNLCQQINDYLLKMKVKPGKIHDVESPIGHYLNFRQEFLLDDHNNMNKTGNLDTEKRIHTIQLSDDDFEKERRKCVIKEQENSELYQYIKSQLKTKFSLQPFSIFQSLTIKEPLKEKKQNTISPINLSKQNHQ